MSIYLEAVSRFLLTGHAAKEPPTGKSLKIVVFEVWPTRKALAESSVHVRLLYLIGAHFWNPGTTASGFLLFVFGLKLCFLLTAIYENDLLRHNAAEPRPFCFPRFSKWYGIGEDFHK